MPAVSHLRLGVTRPIEGIQSIRPLIFELALVQWKDGGPKPFHVVKEYGI
jgi:hypothetical protein